jgi:integrase
MLSRDLERYIDGKRSLGFKFRSQSVQLRSFVAFAESRGDRYVRSARVLAWAGKAPSPQHRQSRLLLVRRFALALHAENARHQVPGTDALGRATTKRRSPYIYAPGEITRLLQASAALEPAGAIRPIMYTTLLGLIAATGMRIAEALALRLDDVTADGLVIRETTGFVAIRICVAPEALIAGPIMRVPAGPSAPPSKHAGPPHRGRAR